MWCDAGHHVSICSTKTLNARSIGGLTRTDLRTTASSAFAFMLVSCLGFFGGGAKACECRRPHLIEVSTEACHSFRIEAIEAAGAGLAVNDKADVFKHLQVLGDRGARDRERPR